ncbi:hypothetical protein [Halomarina oriensis]|uniref:Glycosyltransferase RgtA/B/C/D-like domain-containing protein n=1 Tax=Halomarina oriensis TaxID=671145 RepID=A0A6B0GQ88_9EURY|nr:hypothetical protein [Halomarina oriensis]MWG36974.1 hypothetical protein [Halomarina oriensis]
MLLERPVDRWEVVALLALLVPGLALAVELGGTPISVYDPNVDPGAFVANAERLAATGDLFATRDPPFRYLPLAVVYALVEPTATGAERIASTLAAVACFVCTPLALWLFARRVTGRVAALAVVVAFVPMRAVGYAMPGYYVGSWQLDYGQPLVFLALLTAHVASTENRPRPAVVTGGLLGLLATVQLGLAALAALVVGVAFLLARAVRPLSWTVAAGAVGSLPLLAHLALSDAATGHLRGTVSNRILPDGSLVVTWEQVPGVVLASGTLITAALLVVAAVAYRRGLAPESTVLRTGVAVHAVAFVVLSVTNLGYLRYVVDQVGPFLLVVVAVAALGRTAAADRVRTTVDRRTTEETPAPPVLALGALLAVATTAVLFLGVPTNLPT